jgi:predicted DNA binding protein
MNDEAYFLQHNVKRIQTVVKNDFTRILDIVDIHDDELDDFINLYGSDKYHEDFEVIIGINKSEDYYIILVVPNYYDEESEYWRPYADNISLRQDNKYYIDDYWEDDLDTLYFKVPREKKTLVENYLKNNNPHY